MYDKKTTLLKFKLSVSGERYPVLYWALPNEGAPCVSNKAKRSKWCLKRVLYHTTINVTAAVAALSINQSTQLLQQNQLRLNYNVNYDHYDNVNFNYDHDFNVNFDTKYYDFRYKNFETIT